MNGDPYKAPSDDITPNHRQKSRVSKVIHVGLIIIALLSWYFPLLMGLSIKSLNLMLLLHGVVVIHVLGGDTKFPLFSQNHLAFGIAEAGFVILLFTAIRVRSWLVSAIILFTALLWIAFNLGFEFTMHPMLD